MSDILRLLGRLLRLRLLRLLSRPAPRPAAPATTCCERCGMLVDCACHHRNCPLARRTA